MRPTALALLLCCCSCPCIGGWWGSGSDAEDSPPAWEDLAAPAPSAELSPSVLPLFDSAAGLARMEQLRVELGLPTARRSPPPRPRQRQQASASGQGEFLDEDLDGEGWDYFEAGEAALDTASGDGGETGREFVRATLSTPQLDLVWRRLTDLTATFAEQRRDRPPLDADAGTLAVSVNGSQLHVHTGLTAPVLWAASGLSLCLEPTELVPQAAMEDTHRTADTETEAARQTGQPQSGDTAFDSESEGCELVPCAHREQQRATSTTTRNHPPQQRIALRSESRQGFMCCGSRRQPSSQPRQREPAQTC